MLPSTSPREALLACPPSPWNLPSFTVESILSSSCSCSDLLLSRQGTALAHLDSLPPHDLAYLPTALSVALRPLFPSQQAQYVLVFQLKPALFCTLFAGLGSTNKFATFLLLLSDSFLTTLFSPPSFLLSQTLWQFWQKLSSFSSCSIRLQWVPEHSFLSGNDAADELARRGALLAPSAVPCSLSLISRIHFSRTGGILSHLNYLTHRFPQFPPKNLCSLIALAVFSFVFAATDLAYC